MPMRVEDFLIQSARKNPDKIALICQQARFTYRDIDQASDRLARSLWAGGVVRGDRIGIFLDNAVEAVISIFGVLKAAGVFVMINPSTPPHKLAYILNDCRAVGLISHTQYTDMLIKSVPCIASLRLLILGGLAPFEVENKGVLVMGWDEAVVQQTEYINHPMLEPLNEQTLAMVIYTSGTTGFPKGVMMTHLNIVSVAASITQYLENRSDDIILSALPLSFDYGLYQVLMAFKVGATILLEKSFAFPQVIINQLLEKKVTGLPLVPMMVAILIKMKGLTPGHFPCLRYITNTADTLSLLHIKKMRFLFPETKIFSMYGQTECKRISYLPPDQIDIRPDSVGIAIPNTEVTVVDERGERVGPGVVGELVVRGAHVMQGYWEKEEETKRALRPWHLSGEKVLYTRDLFKTDAEGFLYFVGRQDDIIKTRGEKVSPKEVERVLCALPEVAEAAVIGVPDPVLGHVIKALIVLTSGGSLTPEAVLLHCKQNLEAFMIPKFVVFLEALPKTEMGKIKKGELS